MAVVSKQRHRCRSARVQPGTSHRTDLKECRTLRKNSSSKRWRINVIRWSLHIQPCMRCGLFDRGTQLAGRPACGDSSRCHRPHNWPPAHYAGPSARSTGLITGTSVSSTMSYRVCCAHRWQNRAHMLPPCAHPAAVPAAAAAAAGGPTPPTTRRRPPWMPGSNSLPARQAF